MNLKRNLTSIFSATVVATILAGGSPALVAEVTTSSSPAPAASARITALSGTLLNKEGKPLEVGSEVKAGDIVKTPAGEIARFTLTKAGTNSSIICIQPESEVAFLKLAPSSDSDYPVMDAELSLRNSKLRSETKRVF